MKKVVAYLAGVPSSHKSPHKIEVLKRFVEGVSKNGDMGISHTANTIIPADVGVIQGWMHAGSPNTPHLILRKHVAENKQNRHTIIVDSNLFNYKTKNHPTHYSRYSMDGVFPTTGNYFWDNPDPARWKQISRDLNITLKDWRTKGDHILICTQRNGGWSMQGTDVSRWLIETIETIRKYSDRPIIIRPHPGDREAQHYLKKMHVKDYKKSTNISILDDFKNAHAVITYNSTPGVAASIEGIPVFITDPIPMISQAYDVGNHDISKIENPEVKERQLWIEKISMCHWKFEELSSGIAWQHMKYYI